MNERKFSLIPKEIDFLKEVKKPQILFIGDSYFQLWYKDSLQEFSFFNNFNKETSLNLGIGSTKFKDWTYLLDDFSNIPEFKKVVINLGFNDIHHTEETTYQDTYNDLILFLDKFRNIYPNTLIYLNNIVISPLYENIRERIETYNSLVRKNQKELGITLIDIASKIDEEHQKNNCFVSDGMHLTNAGYAVFVREIKKAIKG